MSRFWNFPTHAGNVVNGWWRMIWIVAGLVPLLLMVTGLSTWFSQRGTRKRRRRLEHERAAGRPAPVEASAPGPALADALRVADPPLA